MSSAYIIAIIVILLIALTCYAFLAQSMEKKRQQRLRMVSALKARAKSFKHMLNGFPQDFLTQDLQILVNRCLVDVTEQLARLEPGEKLHVDELQMFSHQLEEIKTRPKSDKRKPLENPQQVKEVKHHLEELNAFIAQMIKRGNLTSSQGASFEKQIKKLVLQMTVDTYLLNGKQSQQSEKTRLAVHYYTLALKLLIKENTEQTFQKQIAQLRQIIAGLEQKLQEEEPQYADTVRSNAAKEAAAKEWEEIEGPDEPWKKKNLYD